MAVLSNNCSGGGGNVGDSPSSCATSCHNTVTHCSTPSAAGHSGTSGGCTLSDSSKCNSSNNNNCNTADNSTCGVGSLATSLCSNQATTHTSTSAVAEGGKVCRDFLRKVCRRGNRCKFVHVESDSGGDVTSTAPPSSHTNTLTTNSSNNGSAGATFRNSGSPNSGGGGQQGCGTAVSATQGSTQLTFCHDYQNSHCKRNCCKFIHCTCEEENQYLQTGHIPPHVLDQAIRKGQMADATLNGDIPICKDYLMGECEKRRGGKCKFRHLNQTEYHQEIYGYSTLTPPPPPQPPPFRPHHQGSNGVASGPGAVGAADPHAGGHLVMNGGSNGRRMDLERGGRGPGEMYDSSNIGHDTSGCAPPRQVGMVPQFGPGHGVSPPDHKRQRLDPSAGGPTIMYQDYIPVPRDPQQQQQHQQQHQQEFGGAGGCERDYVLEMGRADMMRDVNAMRDFREPEPLNEWERHGMEMTVMRRQMENMKKEITILKKENSDLRATNDFLLDKVTSIGARKMNCHVSTSSSSILPTVSLAPASLAASSMPSLTASLSAAAAQVTPVSHPLTIVPPMSMALQQSIAHPTIAPPSIAPQSIAGPTECTVQAGVQHPLSNPLSITSISTDGSVGSVVAIAAPSQPPPPSQPPSVPSSQSMAPAQAVAVAAAAPTAAVVVSVGTVQVPLSQAAITITSGTLNPRITTTSMSMTLPSIATAPTIVPSIGQTIAAPAAANIAQAISMSQGGQAIAMSQGGPTISMTAPPISMSAPQAIAISGPQSMSISGAAAGQLLSYPIMSQPTLRTQLH